VLTEGHNDGFGIVETKLNNELLDFPITYFHRIITSHVDASLPLDRSDNTNAPTTGSVYRCATMVVRNLSRTA
jgi:hypothetical protein